MGIARVGIEITGDGAGARRALGSAENELKGFRGKVRSQFSSLGGELKGILSSQLAGALSLAVVAAGLRAAFQAADELAASSRKLAATSTLAGQNLGFLQKTAAEARESFGLSTRQANEFTISLVKLTSKAGEVGKTGLAIGALLDLAAAKGLTAADALEAINQALVGQDEGTDKLFGKNPSVIYEEWAEKAGVAASKMSDGEKALALLDAILSDGAQVRGEYGKWLESAAGQQFMLQVKTEEAAASIGRSMEGVRMAVLPVLADLAQKVVEFVAVVQLLGAELPVHIGRVKLWARELNAEWGGALKGIADKMVGFYEWTRTLPPWLQWVFGLPVGNVLVGSVSRALSAGLDGTIAEAKAELAALQAEYEKVSEQIINDMRNATSNFGNTAPVLKPRAPTTGDADGGLSKADKKRLDGSDKPRGPARAWPGLPELDATPVAVLDDASRAAGSLRVKLADVAESWRDSIGGALSFGSAIQELADGALNGLVKGVQSMFQAMFEGGRTAGQAFKESMLSAIGAVAAHLGRLALAESVLAIGRAIAGDARQVAAAAKMAAAGVALLAVAGAAGAASGGGAGGGGGVSSGTLSRAESAAPGAKGSAEIILTGSWTAFLADPVAQDAFQSMLEDLSDRRVTVRYGG